MLAHLIGFDTTTSISNLDLISFVETYLQQWGLTTRRFPNEDGSKANLYARIGPEIAGGIALSGHTDVIPVDRREWRADPFTLTEHEHRLYGRGTADMKTFVAAILAALPRMSARPLRTPIHFCLSYDEEIGCRGVPSLIAALAEDPQQRPDFAIIGEPTGMNVVHSHKSIISMETEIHGREGHSSDPRRGVNAIAAAAAIVTKLGELAQQCEHNGDPTGLFDPPWSTIHVGVIHGGTVRNVIPGHCRIQWEMRGLPDFDKTQIINDLDLYCADLVTIMRQQSDTANIQTTLLHEVVALNGDPASDSVRLALGFAGKNASHAVPYMTEAGLFAAAGIPAIVCGPGHIAQAHQPDEYIDIDQLNAVDQFVDRLINYAQNG